MRGTIMMDEDISFVWVGRSGMGWGDGWTLSTIDSFSFMTPWLN